MWKLHSKRVEKMRPETSAAIRVGKKPVLLLVRPETVILHSKRVGKMYKYTRNGWGRCKSTLKTSGKDLKLHSKRVGKIWNYTQNEWTRCKTTLETSGEDLKLHSKRVGKMWITSVAFDQRYRAFEFQLGALFQSHWIDLLFTLVSSVVLHLLHSFRV